MTTKGAPEFDVPSAPRRIHQDGREFYDDSGQVVFTASTRVTDGDCAAAARARDEFIGSQNADARVFVVFDV